MNYQEANSLRAKIDKAFELDRQVYYHPEDPAMIEIIAITEYAATLATGSTISLLDNNVRRDSFYFSGVARTPEAIPYQQELEDRRESVKNAPTWVEAKEQRLLYAPVPNRYPDDRMFENGGQLYPTKCYQADDRTRALARFLPVRYDINYVLDFYQSRVIKELSLENQLRLLRAIANMYPVDLINVPIADIKDCLDSMNDVDKLQLCKELADSLGKRIIKK